MFVNIDRNHMVFEMNVIDGYQNLLTGLIFVAMCLFRDELQFTACLRSIEQTNCELETRSDAIVLAAYRKIEHECNTEEHVMRQQDEAIEREERERDAQARVARQPDPEH
ncbi:hypothetical protein GQX74_012204 [Glossina fuscipes]|nr:hypothetical protein GQX74_012204 [Glossina fuscipes]